MKKFTKYLTLLKHLYSIILQPQATFIDKHTFGLNAVSLRAASTPVSASDLVALMSVHSCNHQQYYSTAGNMKLCFLYQGEKEAVCNECRQDLNQQHEGTCPQQSRDQHYKFQTRQLLMVAKREELSKVQ